MSQTLRTEDLVKVYHGKKVVAGISMEVDRREVVGLLGPNGAGKTTSFYMTVGLIKADKGRVFLDDEEISDYPMYLRARKGINYLPQEPSVFRKLTVEENILAILETLDLTANERGERLEQLLGELKISHLRKNKAFSLSAGRSRSWRLSGGRPLPGQPLR